MASTYEPIATTTLSSSTPTITFSSIPATYTDLKLVFTGKATTSSTYFGAQFNSDTSSNYSTLFLYGNATAAYSQANRSQINFADTTNVAGLDNVKYSVWTVDILSYTSAIWKTCLFRGGEDYWGVTNAGAGTWRSTSAINRIDLLANEFGSGTVVTLFGILKA